MELVLGFTRGSPSCPPRCVDKEITSSTGIYGNRSYVKWLAGGVRHGALAGKRREVAFGVFKLALLG